MATVNEKMAALADAIRSKAGVVGALSIDGMTSAIDGIIINPPSSESADVSGVTATANDVLASAKFVDNTGALKSGAIQTVTLEKSGNTVSVKKGYVAADSSITVESGGGGGTGDSTVKFGYWTTDGKFQAVDLSGDAPVDSGEPIAVDAVMFKTGQPEPDYPGSGGSGDEMQFYVCTGYDGVVEKIIVTAGAITDDMDEPVSLVGEYTIVDLAAVGTARKWYCPATTASGDYPAYTYGVTIGCAEIEVDWNDDGPVYERKWGISYGNTVYDDCWLMAEDPGIESPFEVPQWQSNSGSVAVSPVLTSDVEDVAPYGPTGWSGRPIVMTDKPVFFSYGAGLKNSNGFWEQIAGEGITKESQWRLIGGNAIIADGHAPDDSYAGWTVYSDSSKSPSSAQYSTAGMPISEQPVIHPGLRKDWSSASGSFNPPPTFVYSETGGYFPAETAVSGLTYTGKPPEIGGFYNADATIKAEKFFPA